MKFQLMNGTMTPIVDGMMEHAKEQAKVQIQTWLMAGLDVLKDISFELALIGGGICFLVYFMTGIQKALKAGSLLVMVHFMLELIPT